MMKIIAWIMILFVVPLFWIMGKIVDMSDNISERWEIKKPQLVEKLDNEMRRISKC